MKQVSRFPVFWSIYLTLLATHSQGQSVFAGLPALTPAYVNNFSAERHLPQACASDMMMDRRGRLWVATCPVMAGVNSVRLFQFDGYEFNPVNLANDSLPNRTVAILKQTTPEGELLGWFQSDDVNAVFFFNPDRQNTRAVPFPLQEGLIKDLVLQTDGGILLVLMKPDSLSLYRLDRQLRKECIATWYNPDPAPELSEYTKLGVALFASGDDVLVASSSPLGLFQLNLRERRVRPCPVSGLAPAPLGPPQPGDLITDEFCARFITTRRGELLCFVPGSQHQVYVRHSAGGSFEPMQDLPAGYTVFRMEQDSAENILFLLQDSQRRYAGLLYDRQGNKYNYSAFVSDHADIYNLRSGNFFQSILICAADGLSYKSVLKENSVQCLLPGYSIRGMVEAQPGLFYITSENKPTVSYQPSSGKIETQTAGMPWAQAFDKGMIRTFNQSADGSLWAHRGDTLVQYDPLTGTHRDCSFFPLFWYQTLLADGRVAIYTQQQGLWLFDPVSGNSSPLVNGDRLRSIKGLVHVMRQTRDGKLWLLTTNGLWQIDLAAGVQKCLGFEPPFRDFRFLCMAEADDGKLWLGTFLGGIHIYNPATGAVQVVDKSKGLPNNTIASITRDATGDFWAATYQGLARLSPEGVVMANLLSAEGLCETEFNRYAALRAQDGTLLLGTLNGLHVIHPQSLAAQREAGSAPQIYLTALTVADAKTGAERTYQAAFDALPELVLPPDRRHLRVHFALSSYVQPDRNQFAYLLEGVDKTWTFIGPQHELSFNDLPAGTYTLLIKGCDFQGNWTATPVRIPIHAREFFYKQPWFYALCLLPFVAFAWVWLNRLRSEKKRLEKEVHKRTRQIQQDKELIEQQAHELLHLDEVKSRFFTNISHELRTPITLITAPVEQLIGQYAGTDFADLRQSLQRVLYNGRNLSALVEELLELSRLEAGKIELQEKPTDFYRYCRQLFGAFESQAQMKRIRYGLDYAAEKDLALAIDRRRLEKIINNLISNALKFTPTGGEVRMLVEQENTGDPGNTRIVIRVADSGRGIPPEDLPHLFERYFQTKRSDLAREGGTGIGLALAKELAQLMKGDLRAETAWGKGSTFTLVLTLKKSQRATPLPVAAAPVAETEIAAPPSTNGHRKGLDHLLIVEDNPDMQALLRSLLSDDYALTFTNDGQEAWDLLGSEDPRVPNLSLILSDVMMPRMDGYELLEKIKSHPRWRPLPVILLTARAEQEDKIQALRLGVDDYLVKPFSPAELGARVSNLIANYRGRQVFSEKTAPAIAFEKTDSRADVWLKTIETAAKVALEKGLPLQVGYLAEAGAMSERQFFREIKSLTGLTPNQYIQEVRLQKARHLLQHRAYGTLAEVAYAVGFDTPGYFTKIFEAHFGKHPSAYLDLPAVAG